MSRREPSIAEFIAWIHQLDDPYKVFLFSLLNAIYLYAVITIGHSIDPDTIKGIFLGELIESLGNETLSWFWVNLFQPLSFVAGMVELAICLYAIWKFRLLGAVVALSGFVGWVILLFRISMQWPQEVFYFGVALVLISFIVAVMKSSLKFDDSGRVVMD